MPQVWATSNDKRAQTLVADQPKVGVIHYRATLWCAPAIRTVTGSAEDSVNPGTPGQITWRVCRVRRRRCVTNFLRPAPASTHFADENLDLLIGQSTAGAFDEAGHARARNAVLRCAP